MLLGKCLLETRHKQDTQIKLRQNQAQQNHLSDAAYKAELDRKGKESQDNVQVCVSICNYCQVLNISVGTHVNLFFMTRCL